MDWMINGMLSLAVGYRRGYVQRSEGPQGGRFLYDDVTAVKWQPVEIKSSWPL